jgi:nucleoside 2-deoxyribosyltransferase
MHIFLSSPLGFSESGRMFYYKKLLPMLGNLGYAVIDPWVLTDPALLETIRQMPPGAQRRDAYAALNFRIGLTNAEAIDRCDAVLAVLDGVDVDSGTAAEIGYASARGKPIAGYRGDFRLSADNEGSIVNLQVEYFIFASGGKIVTDLAEIPEVLARLLSGH